MSINFDIKNSIKTIKLSVKKLKFKQVKSFNNLTILFWAHQARTGRDGLVPLYARITFLGKRAEISLSLKVNLEKWDVKLGLVNDHSQDAKKINAELGSIRKDIEKAYNILRDTTDFITATKIKSKFLGEDISRKMLLEVFEEHNAKMAELVGKTVVKGTLVKYETIKSKLSEFITYKFKTKDVYLHSLQYSFIIDFEHYLKVHDKISHNVVMSYIKRVKKIVNIAVDNGWLNSSPFKKFVCTTKKILRTELGADEIKVLREKVFEVARLEEVRDCYLFSCYTGYAFVDASKLTPKHIKNGIDGEMWIETSRTKSKIEASVPLLPPAIEIIEKYKDHPACVSANRILPMKSNQKMNAYLKEIATICGIDKSLTTHTARHTFATTVTLSNDVPIETVSKMLGHTKITTTQIYARVHKKKISNDMKILREKFSME